MPEELSHEEKQELVSKINSAPPGSLAGLVKIIKESTTYQGDKNNIKLDLDKIDGATQKQLLEYMKNL